MVTVKKYQGAVKIMLKAISEDDELRVAWESNISMCFQDNMARRGYKLPDLSEIANKSANDFINLLLGKFKTGEVKEQTNDNQ